MNKRASICVLETIAEWVDSIDVMHTKSFPVPTIDGPRIGLNKPNIIQRIIDAPPTALLSLRRAGISPADIETIFVTQHHGDHVFGLPFLLLEKKYISDREGNRPLTIVGSVGVRERRLQLCSLAFPGSLDDAWISSGL